MKHSDIQKLFDTNGNLIGVFLPATLWQKVAATIETQSRQKGQEDIEPIADWNTLCKYWDFQYPIDKSVNCTLCSSSTTDWQQDDPRKFRLLAASLGGLVCWRCQNCQARVSKYHFKDKITHTCEPFKH